MLTVAGVQMNVVFGKREQNLARIEHALDETARRGARLVVFPECAVPGYCFESLAEALPLAETLPGPSTERLARRCRELQLHVVFGLLERDGPRVFNAAALVGPEGYVAGYRKIHLPFLGVDRFTTPGDRPFAVHQAGELRMGMNICYDGAFPEAARVMALEGADLIALPTNWPPGAECTADCVIAARAMENNVYYLAVNRVGTERGFRFIGKSKVCDPAGRVLAEAQHEDEAILYAEIDLERARRKRVIRVPGLHEIDRFADRRPEMYGKIVEPKQPI
ncbi:MAG TPA: carbon-nitrogen hydrolase family protein [Pirellulales bacterium]|jgi:predicted amidohydrolase|nr:carbon-nitrogen hydrolase family protein [Pirellulales bacterium]